MTIKQHIPNLFTLLSLAGGSVAIVTVFSNQVFMLAPWILFGCAVLDFMDGYMARLLHAYSDMGKELDSLADIVSFGVAPGIMMFRMLENNFGYLMPGTDFGVSIFPLLYGLFAVLIPVFSALRLARFNIDTTQATSFRGLPTPASAIIIVFTYFLYYTSNNPAIQSVITFPVVLPILCLLLAILMVNPVRLLSLKFKNFSIKDNAARYIIIIMGIILILLFGVAGGLLTMASYILISLIAKPV